MRVKINGQYLCPQCEDYYDYKEMADENICQECVHQKREFQKVDLKQLLNTMQDEDIDEVIRELDIKENELRDVLMDEIKIWLYYYKDGNDIKKLADKIINIIK